MAMSTQGSCIQIFIPSNLVVMKTPYFRHEWGTPISTFCMTNNSDFSNIFRDMDPLSLFIDWPSYVRKTHRKCIRSMQSLPSRTATDVALSLMAFNRIITDNDYRKLVFLGQLTSLSIHCITNELFIHRVINYIDTPRNIMGFIPDISSNERYPGAFL